MTKRDAGSSLDRPRGVAEVLSECVAERQPGAGTLLGRQYVVDQRRPMQGALLLALGGVELPDHERRRKRRHRVACRSSIGSSARGAD